jgi:hypothetical protein
MCFTIEEKIYHILFRFDIGLIGHCKKKLGAEEEGGGGQQDPTDMTPSGFRKRRPRKLLDTTSN